MDFSQLRSRLSLQGLVTGFFAVIFASYFFLNSSDHRAILYIGAPLLLIYLYKNYTTLKGNIIWRLLAAVGGYFLINYISIAWSDYESPEKILQRGKMIFLFPLLLAPFMIAHARDERFWKICLTAFVTSAIVSAPLLIMWQWDYISKNMRLYGWGRAENPVQCGLLYGLGFLLFVYCKDSLYFYKKLPWYASYALGIIPLTALILTKSRGPLIVTLIILVGILLSQLKLTKAFIFKRIIPMLFLITVVGLLFIDYGSAELQGRGSTGRMQVWAGALEAIKEKPVFGHGIAAKLRYPFEWNGTRQAAGHPHSVYLSALVHTGIVGLILQMIAVTLGLYYAFKRMRNNKDASTLILISFGCLLGLVDLGGYYTNLGTTWMVFWFPLALLAVATPQLRK